LKFGEFVYICVNFLEKHHMLNFESWSIYGINIYIGYFSNFEFMQFMSNFYYLCAKMWYFIRPIWYIIGGYMSMLYSTLPTWYYMGIYDYIYEFIWSWNSSFFKPKLVVTRSLVVFQSKASLSNTTTKNCTPKHITLWK